MKQRDLTPAQRISRLGLALVLAGVFLGIAQEADAGGTYADSGDFALTPRGQPPGHFADSGEFALTPRGQPPGHYADSGEFALTPRGQPPGHFADSGPFPFDSIEADIDRNGCVNVSDLVGVRILLGAQGSAIDPPLADVNADGIVNVSDYVLVRTALGYNCQ